jgi:hypothetical protein
MYRGSTSRKMHFVLVQPDQSVATNTLHRLHLRSYVSVLEWSTARLIHTPLLIPLSSPCVFNVGLSVIAVDMRRLVE